MFDADDNDIGQIELSVSFVRMRRDFGDLSMAKMPGQDFPGSFLTNNKCKIGVISLRFFSKTG